MYAKISGGRGDGTDWPDPGVPFDVDAEEGRQLCAAHLAYPVAEQPAAEMPDVQTATGVETRYDSGGFPPPGTSVARNETGVPEPVRSTVPKPIVNSPKAAWVEYAVTLGADRAEADAMKKTDLIARYGNS